MGGAFSIGGLVSGLDTNNIIEQLMLIEQQPVFRMQERIAGLEQQREAITALRNTLRTLGNRAQDFKLFNSFDQSSATSSDEGVLTAQVSSSNPVLGSYSIDVTQLASATSANSSAVLGAAINPAAALNAAGLTQEIEAGTFTINGQTFNVDPATDSLNDILADITADPLAGVTATYDPGTDKVVIENATPGDTSLIVFGGSGDTSNFLSAMNLVGATQYTNAGGSTEVTSTRNLGAVQPGETLNAVNFAGGAVTAGVFYINGAAITVDPTTDALADVIVAINESDAGVSASYDAANDTIRVVSDTLGSRTINFTSGTSNFLDVANLTTAVQNVGSDSQFTVNGGPVQTRNSNEVTDAVSGVTLTFLSTGTSTVTVDTDEDAMIEDVQEFVDAFNTALTDIYEQVGQGGALESDMGIRMVGEFLRTTVFDRVGGSSGDYDSLVQVGFSSGEGFDSEAIPQLSLDTDALRSALQSNRTSVESLFTNAAGDGVMDQIDEYLEEVTASSGFLSARTSANGTIDQQIESLNGQIDRLMDRIELKEERMREQFARMEQLMSQYQSQGSSLAGLSSGLSSMAGLL